MRAVTGDLPVLKNVETGAPVRDGRVLDVRGDERSPIYLVRWSDTGDVELYLADECSDIHHFEGGGSEEFSLATGFTTEPPEDSKDGLSSAVGGASLRSPASRPVAPS